jgi:hypothetical protein
MYSNQTKPTVNTLPNRKQLPMSAAVPIDIGKKVIRAVITYMAYFGAKYVGNDIQVLCGNILDHALVKSFTLFCIMFQATDNLKLALLMTAFFMTCQYLLSLSPVCNKYVDKTVAPRIDHHATVWPRNKDVDDLGRKVCHPIQQSRNVLL